MLQGDSSARVEHYASPEQLRVGLYVYLDLPWFRHPFTLNSFKIASELQVSELRALEIPRYRYDPERSECLPDEALPEPAPGPEVAAEEDAAALAAASGAAAAAAANPRFERVRAYRRAAECTEHSFLKAAGLVRRLDRDLASRPGETLQELNALLGQMVTVFLDRPDVTLQVMGENCGGEEAYHHSLNVSILCMMLVRGLALDREQAVLLGMGALLHDIGLRQIPDSVLKKDSREQTKPERGLRATHVARGAALGRRLGLAPEILSIIEQHHEMCDGSGYPCGLTCERIAPLARVVALVNYYDTLCNPVDFAHGVTPHEALSFIFARRKEQFDALVLQLMIRSLGVYPPGSIVQLSNDAIAMVISVNPHTSLRPWVLLYDAAVPREEAMLVNLETEADMSISQAIRPAQLPAPIYAYLSPRRRITYYFDSGPPDPGERK